MSSVTIPYDHASIGTYHGYTPAGGMADFLVKKFVAHGNSLVARINFGFTGAFTYYVDGVERVKTDGGFNNNVDTELFDHSESDGDHVVYIPGANYVALANSYTVTSAGTASFRKTDDWGEFADFTDNVAGNGTKSFPAYVTTDGTDQAFTTAGTYGQWKPHGGTSFRVVGTGSSINIIASIAVKEGKIALFKDGVYHATFNLTSSSLVTDARRLHTIFTGIDGTTSHEWRVAFACTDISVHGVQLGHTAGAGTISHSPSFLPMKVALVVGDSIEDAAGLPDFSYGWTWLAFITGGYYIGLINAGIGGTSLRDYTGDGTHVGNALFTTSSMEALTETVYKLFSIDPDLIVVSGTCNDDGSSANVQTSNKAMCDSLLTAFPAADMIQQKSTVDSAYDTARSNTVAYLQGIYTTVVIRLGPRATGVTLADFIHPDQAGSITKADQFVSQNGDLLTSVDTTAPTLSSATINSAGTTLTLVFSEAVIGVDDAVDAGDFRLSTLQTLSSAATADGITWTITCALVTALDSPTLRYFDADGYVADDPAGNLLLEFAGASVTNGSTINVPGAPVLSVDGLEATESGIQVAPEAPASDGGSAVLVYEIWHNIASAGFVQIGTITAANLGNHFLDRYVLTGLSVAIKVRCRNAIGNSAYSATRTVTSQGPDVLPVDAGGAGLSLASGLSL